MKNMHQRGAALIEFALVTPLLIMVLIGLIEVGRLAYFSIEVANAAHAGAQYGAISYKNAGGSGMGVAAQKDGQNGVAHLQTTADYVCACWNPSTAAETPSTPTQAACGVPCSNGGHTVTYAQVSVTGTMHALFNYTALGLPAQWAVTRVATMRVEQAP